MEVPKIGAERVAHPVENCLCVLCEVRRDELGWPHPAEWHEKYADLNYYNTQHYTLLGEANRLNAQSRRMARSTERKLITARAACGVVIGLTLFAAVALVGATLL